MLLKRHAKTDIKDNDNIVNIQRIISILLFYNSY